MLEIYYFFKPHAEKRRSQTLRKHNREVERLNITTLTINKSRQLK